MKAITPDGRPLKRTYPDPVPNPVNLAWMEDVFAHGIQKPFDYVPFKYTDVDWDDELSISFMSYHAFLDLLNIIYQRTEELEVETEEFKMMETLEWYFKDAKWSCSQCYHFTHYLDAYPINGSRYGNKCLCKVCYDRLKTNWMEAVKENTHVKNMTVMPSLMGAYKLMTSSNR